MEAKKSKEENQKVLKNTTASILAAANLSGVQSEEFNKAVADLIFGLLGSK